MIAARRRGVLLMAVAAAAAMLPAVPAMAAPVSLFEASDFYIPRPATSSDQVGVLRPLVVFDLAANGHADLIGQECRFTVSADNGDSVHLGNYAVITTGGLETDVLGTESAANVTTTTLEVDTLVLGPTIQFSNVMLADPDGLVGTSVDFTVSVDCEATSPPTTAPTTTTTTTSPTTTASSTTSSTTSTAPTTSTVPQPAPTTTIVGSPTTLNAEPPDSSGSSTTSTIGGGEAGTIPPVTGGTLPFTGPTGMTANLAWSAGALIALGSMMVLAAQPRGRHSR